MSVQTLIILATTGVTDEDGIDKICKSYSYLTLKQTLAIIDSMILLTTVENFVCDGSPSPQYSIPLQLAAEFND